MISLVESVTSDLPPQLAAVEASSLELRGVTKTFGASRVLDDVSLSLEAGELLTILGPSGCGKTTLLRVISGLDDPDAGDVRIGGRSVSTDSPKDRGIAFVFQSYALYPQLSCRDNIAAPLVMRELSAFERLPLVGRMLPSAARKRRSIEARVRSVSELLRVEDYLDRFPSQLSGGQRQRIALGRALIRQPALFLLDEPFANLDAALRTHTRTEIAVLQKRLGTTTVFVTHDQTEAMAMSDRIAVMFDGRIRQVATPDALYRDPADLDVARFMSKPLLNELPATVIASGWVAAAGERMRIEDGRRVGAEGTLGFRPEHCRLSRCRRPGGLHFEVERAEHGGSEAHLFLRVGPAKTRSVASVASAELGVWPPGSSGWMEIDDKGAWFFPRSRNDLAEAAARNRDVA